MTFNNVEKLGEWDVIKGDNWPALWKGLECWGMIYNTRMYAIPSKKEAIFVYRLNSSGSRFIFARMVTNKKGKGLYNEVLKVNEIPVEIINDTKLRHETNQ